MRWVVRVVFEEREISWRGFVVLLGRFIVNRRERENNLCPYVVYIRFAYPMKRDNIRYILVNFIKNSILFIFFYHKSSFTNLKVSFKLITLIIST